MLCRELVPQGEALVEPILLLYYCSKHATLVKNTWYSYESSPRGHRRKRKLVWEELNIT
jgi:hypothetical protein